MCQCVCVSFYLKWGFGRQGRGFESGSWFRRDVGLSPHLGFWETWVSVYNIFFFLGGGGGIVGLSPHLYFWGWGSFFFKFCFVCVVVLL